MIRSTLALIAALVCTLSANAAPIVFTPPTTFSIANNVGQARSVIFEVTAPTSVTSFGIQMDPLIGSFSLLADLYTVAPGTLIRGALLASGGPQAFTDVGTAFYDVPLVYNFLPGQRYELEIQPTTSGGFGFGQFNMTFYNFDGNPPSSPPNAPFTVGTFRIYDGGGSGNVGGPGNTVLSLFEANANASAVPEPVTLAVFGGIALAGALGYRRRKATAAA